MERRRARAVFGGSGYEENSAAAALGWTLAQSPALAGTVLEDLLGERVDVEDLRVDMRRHEPELGGFTDIEIRTDSDGHVIVEATAPRGGRLRG